MQKKSKLENCFKTLYDLPINAPLPNPQNIKVFHKAIECIAELGEPKDAIELLMLIDFDKPKPSITMHLKKAAEVISFLMTKQSVRKEWPFLENHYLSCLEKYVEKRVDESIHYPDFNACCKLGCCEHDALYDVLEDSDKIHLLSTHIIPLVKENFPPKIGAHILGIASFDPDGYLREAALKEMEQLDTGNILPYVLLRLNDWVPQVATLAQDILKKMLDNKKVTITQIV